MIFLTGGSGGNGDGNGREIYWNLKLERARFELDAADLVMKHMDKLKSSGTLQIENRSEAAKKIREQLFGKSTKEQMETASLIVA